MKRVILVRHGKAVPFGYEDDFTRNLSDRGKNDSRLISTLLSKSDIRPDAIISSPAKRAIKTAHIFAETLDFKKKNITEIQNIYEGLTTSEFLELIQELPENIETVLFFGHNPGFYYFASNLLEDFQNDMPTCSAVGIEFNVESWNEVEARTGKMAFHYVPKMFK